MNTRFAAASALAVALLAVSATSASAQTTRPAAPPSGSGLPPTTIEGGINFGMRVLNRGVSSTYHPGWSIGASMHATSIISVIASFTGDYKTATGYTANIYSYGGGVRFESLASKQKVRPYLQVVMGGAQDNGDGTGRINHYPFVSPGGGATFVISKHIAVRAMADFPLYMTFGDVFKGARFSTSFAVPIGGRQ